MALGCCLALRAVPEEEIARVIESSRWPLDRGGDAQAVPHLSKHDLLGMFVDLLKEVGDHANKPSVDSKNPEIDILGVRAFEVVGDELLPDLLAFR